MTYDLKTPQKTNRQTQKGKKCNIKHFKSAEIHQQKCTKTATNYENIWASYFIISPERSRKLHAPMSVSRTLNLKNSS